MNRIDRISAILIQLQSKPVVKAQEIADRFGISLRTVYRDIRTLEEAGIPLGSEAGKGYFLAEGFHLPPVMFTRSEAGSMLMAEKLVEKMTDKSIDRHFKSAMYKIRSVLKHGDKDFLQNLDPFIEIAQVSPTASHEFPNDFMADIQDAIAHHKVISLDYMSLSKNEVTRRNIEPAGICFYGSNWHLVAFCRLRNDYRDFRIDRIKKLTHTGLYFKNHEKKSLQEYFNLLSGQEQLEKVTVRFNKSVLPYIQKQKFYFGIIEETEHPFYSEMTFLVTPLEYIGKWLITYGKEVEILSPPALQKIMQDLVIELNEHYGNL